MSIALVRRARRGAFTLLEIALAVAILGMMSMTIYRFVAANLVVLRVSSRESTAEARYAGLINLVTVQLQNLPAGVGALTGEPYKFNDQPRDEITWMCGSGPGLATRYAPDEFLVTMRLKPADEKGGRAEIGLMRKPKDTAEGETEGVSWVPLLEDARSLQIRYFDARLNVWVERWTDTFTLPPLVRLVIGRPDREPREAVIALRRTPLQIMPPAPPTPQAQPGPQTPPGVAPPPGGTPPPPPRGGGKGLTPK